MNPYLILIGILFLSLIITFIILCCWMKLLAWTGDKICSYLNNHKGEFGKNYKPDKMEIFLLSSFDRIFFRKPLQ